MRAAADGDVSHWNTAEGNLQAVHFGQRVPHGTEKAEGLELSRNERHWEDIELDTQRLGESGIGRHRVNHDGPVHLTQ